MFIKHFVTVKLKYYLEINNFFMLIIMKCYLIFIASCSISSFCSLRCLFSHSADIRSCCGYTGPVHRRQCSAGSLHTLPSHGGAMMLPETHDATMLNIVTLLQRLLCFCSALVIFFFNDGGS